MRRFDPADWPPLAGDDEERRRPARHRWHTARTRWCRGHEVELSELIRAGEVEGRYAHLRARPELTL